MQEVRLGNLSSQTKQLINEKVVSYQNNIASIDTTYICGFCHEADTINNLICGFLPIFENISSGSLISIATDYINVHQKNMISNLDIILTCHLN